MLQKIKSYLISFSIISIISLISGIIFFFFLPQFYFPAFPYVFLFTAISHAIFHIWLIKRMYKSPQKFVNSFLLTTTLKLFLILIGLTIILLLSNKNDVFPVTITLLLLFLIYLIFEVNILINFFKK